MTERCIDASIAVKWAVKREPHLNTARRLLRESAANGITLIAPPTFVAEVDSAIRKRVFDGRMIASEAHKASTILESVPVKIIDEPGVRLRAREIAEQLNQRTVYDSTYAALAELHGCEFWTADKAFCDAAKALRFVKYLVDYPR